MAKRDGVWIGDVYLRPVRSRTEKQPQDGRRYWQAVLGRERGAPTRSLGWATRDEAVKLGAELVARGEAARHARVTSVTTLFDVLDLWVGHELDRAELSDETRKGRTRHGRNLAATIGRVRVTDETAVRHAAEDHKRARQAKGCAPSTIRVELGSLHQAWRWARSQGLVRGDGPERVRWTKRERSTRVFTDRTPTYEDASRVYAELAARGPAWSAVLFRTLWETGCRPGEASNLRPADVVPAEGLLRLDGKTGPRWFPASPGLLAELDALDGNLVDDRVWPVTWRTMRRWGPDYLDPACQAAKVQRFTPYGLRRAFVDRAYRSGVAPDVAASLSGHSPEIALRKYRQVSEADARAAARKMAVTLDPGQVVAFPNKTGSE